MLGNGGDRGTERVTLRSNDPGAAIMTNARLDGLFVIVLAVGFQLCSLTAFAEGQGRHRDTSLYAQNGTSLPDRPPTSHVHGGAMSDEAMEPWVQDWYAVHPIVRGGPVTAAAAADTFIASGFTFDTDGSVATQVDTARISVGGSVLWKHLSGIHTVTNGTDSTDPAAGLLFDVPLNATSPEFTFQFNQAGEFPFFCRPHEGFNMRGVVIVSNPVGVEPLAGGSSPGFASEPAPNPTTGAIAFRFRVSKAGRVSLRVLDVRGRLVAQPITGQFDAGIHSGAWNGRTRAGTRARQGVYYLRLDGPGFSASRRIVLSE